MKCSKRKEVIKVENIFVLRLDVVEFLDQEIGNTQVGERDTRTAFLTHVVTQQQQVLDFFFFLNPKYICLLFHTILLKQEKESNGKY